MQVQQFRRNLLQLEEEKVEKPREEQSGRRNRSVPSVRKDEDEDEEEEVKGAP